MARPRHLLGGAKVTTNDYRKTPESLSRLSDEQHRVTQQDGTEPAYRNEY